MSKEPTIVLKHGDVKKFTASNLADPANKIIVNLTIKKYTRLMIMSGLFRNKNIRLSVDYNKIDFNTDNNYYKLDNATYIGTVGSMITDMSMDIYYVTELVGTDNIGYFIIFPTLLLIPNVIEQSTRKFELDAIVAGVADNQPIMRSTALEIPTGGSVTAYLKNVTFLAPTKIAGKLITFPGLDEDSLFTTTEVYHTTGQFNGDDILPNQYMDFGDISGIISGFNATTGINIDIATIKQTAYNKYAYSESSSSTVKGGILCIPLNF